MTPDDLLAITDAWKPDNFQTRRNGTRYYCDPLPTCEIAPATDKAWPGFSSLKPSKPFRKSVPWVDLATGEVAKRAVSLDVARALAYLQTVPDMRPFMGDEWLADNPLTLVEAVENVAWRQAFLDSPRRQLDVDTLRGSAIHAFAESILLDLPVPNWVTDNDQARPFLPHVTSFLETHVRRAIAIEAVVISRSLGYGGTGDAWLELVDGRTTYADWKSRGGDSKHAAYEEEIAQGGAYTGADYMIVPDGTGAKRAAMPATDIGLVVSIRTDGWEAHEYDLGLARQSFGCMIDAYQSTSLSGKRARAAKRGRPVLTAPVAYDRALLQSRIDAIRTHDAEAVKRLAIRLQAADIPTLKQADDHTPEQLGQMDRLVSEMEREVMPFIEPTGEAKAALKANTDRAEALFEVETPVVVEIPRQVSDEGDDVHPGAYADLRSLFDSLDPGRRSWVLERAKEALSAGRAIHMAERPSERRWGINHAVIACSSVGDDDVVRELLGAVVAADWPLMPSFSLGALFGVLNGAEAPLVAAYATSVAAYVAQGDPLPLAADTGRLNLAALRTAA